MWQGDAFSEIEYASFDWDPLTISGHGVVLWQSTRAPFRYVIQTDAQGISRTFAAWTKTGGNGTSTCSGGMTADGSGTDGSPQSFRDVRIWIFP